MVHFTNIEEAEVELARIYLEQKIRSNKKYLGTNVYESTFSDINMILKNAEVKQINSLWSGGGR